MEALPGTSTPFTQPGMQKFANYLVIRPSDITRCLYSTFYFFNYFFYLVSLTPRPYQKVLAPTLSTARMRCLHLKGLNGIGGIKTLTLT